MNILVLQQNPSLVQAFIVRYAMEASMVTHKISQKACGPHYLELILQVTKILTLEMPIFGLKMMVKSGLEFFILKLNKPLQR